jgi:putative membrane protein
MNIGKHIALAGLIGTLGFGVAHAQPRSDGPPVPRERPPAVQPVPDPSAGGAATHQHDAIVVDSSGLDPAKFVKTAALGGMTEVELGKLAQTMARDPKIRVFADDMIKDHTKANTELASLAKSKGLAVPSALDTDHKAIVEKLSAKSGADFDAAYSKQMIDDHDKTISLFEGAAKSADKDIAAFATKMLPTLEKHKQKADLLPTSPP